MARRKSPWADAWGKLPRRTRNPFAPKKVENPPAPRNRGLEDLLCEAIKKQLLVRLLYEDDLTHRLLGPSVVYKTTKEKICVYGIQANDGPHNFEVGKIRSAQLTETHYNPEPINRLDERYANGIICSV